MFHELAQLIVSAADLLEAEGRSARTGLIRLAIALVGVVVAVVLLVAAAGAVLGALYLALRQGLTPALSLLVTGVASLGAGLILIWITQPKEN